MGQVLAKTTQQKTIKNQPVHHSIWGREKMAVTVLTQFDFVCMFVCVCVCVCTYIVASSFPPPSNMLDPTCY